MAGPAPSVECPKCRHSNASGSLRCASCSALLSSEDLTLTEAMGDGWSVVTPGAGVNTLPGLAPGRVIANRYEIIQLLGEGGMGAVFKVQDRQLERVVALKIIRPELAGHPTILRRFKQELLLARQVTHRNVIRIFDLGVADGLHFITMDFVQGRDLNSLLEERKFSPEETGKIIRQVAEALDAAHTESVIHRDLKPHNIMLTDAGKVYVMDFGLARSVEATGLTNTGALLGTPTYMSPEQAKGIAVDIRSDLFSLGVIFYEMLTGEVPFKADTVLGMLLKRTQEPPTPPAQVNPAIPAVASDIVMKCLAIDPAQRYQTARDLVTDLDAWRGVSATSQTMISAPQAAPVRTSSDWRKRWRWPAIGAAALMLILGGLTARRNLFRTPAGPPKAMSVLVADFHNETSDPIFNGTLESAVGTDLEGATFISAANRGDARRVAAQLHPGLTAMDESVAQLVAQRQGIEVVIAGSIASEGDRYRLAFRAIDSFTGKVIAAEQVEGVPKEGVLVASAKLAARIRKALRDDVPEALQIAAAETFSAATLEAAHAYSMGEQAEWSGKTQDAIAEYTKATELDPNLGRAYANIAAMYANTGRMQDADRYHQMAMSHIDRMSDREKYKTRGMYYLLTRDLDKATEELNALVKQYPGDGAGYTNLSLAYFYRRDFAKAVEIGRRASELNPKNVPRHSNLALFAMYAGDFETAEREANATLQLNPAYAKAYLAIGMSQVARGQYSSAAETYKKMESVSALGSWLGNIAAADFALFQGRASEATVMLKNAVATDTDKSVPGALKMTALADAYLATGERARAEQAAAQALASSDATSVQIAAARAFIQAGAAPRAEKIAADLGKALDANGQAYARLIDGEIKLQRGDARAALSAFQESQKLEDTWLGRFDLGRVYLELKAYTDADSELDACLKRRGEATAVFLDDIPTYRYFPEVYYYQGKVREALGSPGAPEAFRNFLALRSQATNDPLVADAKRRAATR